MIKFIIGLLLGAFIGMFIMALLVTSSRSDEDNQEKYKDNK